MTTDTLTHTASREELKAIAMLVGQIRWNWNPTIVESILLAHAHQVDAGDLAIAAIRAAQNPTYHSPKVIGWRGPHWRDLNTRPIEQRRMHYCGVCGKREDRCETQRFADDDHAFEPTTTRPRWERAR